MTRLCVLVFVLFSAGCAARSPYQPPAPTTTVLPGSVLSAGYAYVGSACTLIVNTPDGQVRYAADEVICRKNAERAIMDAARAPLPPPPASRPAPAPPDPPASGPTPPKPSTPASK